ncbi:AarF/UbiB family protein [Myxococcus stipitatus]|uniref:ABC1 kinase family protein n=1 Tax=Myxococcus stipitatus TaxID=83455 RepID=UPI001F39CAC5|nr:AarF/UbiB family protein [Myxococcus stipitatus]MCE9671348.1 AarF/UbiB family protein [Myxococcus stipitatus]
MLSVWEAQARQLALARVLRRFLERAGGAWVKLGQVLAMRIDFFPPRVVEVLSSLLDRIPSFPFEEARRIVEADLGGRLRELFSAFPEEPIAAASFGQVYRATLPSGEVVAVKVQRPGLRTLIAADVVALRGLAFWVDSLRLLGSLRLGAQVTQLQESLEEELDYGFEAENLRRAQEVSRYNRIVRIPRLHEELLGPRVLTMEFLDGCWVSDVLSRLRSEGEAGRERLEEEAGLDLPLVAQRIFDIGMRHLFDVRIFHADPHAANIVILEGDVVGYVDFGIVGTMDEDLADTQERYFVAVQEGRVSDAAATMVEMVEIPERRRDRIAAFRGSVETLIRGWLARMRDGTLEDKSTARLLLNTLAIIREYDFNLAPGAMRYFRALILSDVIILQLDPDFDFVHHLRRYFRRRQIRRLREWTRPERLRKLAADYAELFIAAPTLTRRLSEAPRNRREALIIRTGLLDRVYSGLRLASLTGLVTVLGARGFGIQAVDLLIPPGVSLDWKLAAAAFLLSWRVFATLSR